MGTRTKMVSQPLWTDQSTDCQNLMRSWRSVRILGAGLGPFPLLQVLTLGGSIRRRIGSLEVLNGDGNSSGGSGRAKENTYSFV